MQHVDEAELAAGRVNDIEASISGQNQVDIRAGEGPPVVSFGLRWSGRQASAWSLPCTRVPAPAHCRPPRRRWSRHVCRRPRPMRPWSDSH